MLQFLKGFTHKFDIIKRCFEDIPRKTLLYIGLKK